jgi:hypothetical protein
MSFIVTLKTPVYSHGSNKSPITQPINTILVSTYGISNSILTCFAEIPGKTLTIPLDNVLGICESFGL